MPKPLCRACSIIIRQEQQAALMRDAREAKRAEKHTCPPSDIDTQMTLLEEMLKRVADGNIAPIPIAVTLENGLWTVDVSVRLHRITDYEVSGSAATLPVALANARRSLAHQQGLIRQATRDAARFAYTY